MPVRAALLWGVAALLAAILFSALVYPNVSPSSDVWDYAQEARQIARGQGFTSLYTYPTHLGPDDQPPYPVRWRMPLYAWRGAAVLWSGGALPQGFFLAVAQSHAVLVALVFLLGVHLHSRHAGMIAAATAIVCPLFLDAFNPAMSQVPAAAIMLLVWLLLLRGRGSASALLAAVPAAAAWYLRGESILMAPLWIWVAWRVRPRRAVLFGAVYLALCAAWPLYLSGATGSASSIHGNPMLLYTPEYPGYSSARSYGEQLPGALEYVLRHPGTFVFRWIKDLLGFGLDLLAGPGPVAIGLGVAGILLRESGTRLAVFRPALPFLAAIALQIAFFSAFERSPRFLVPVATLACVIAGMMAAPVLDRVSGRRAIPALLAILIAERALTVGFQTREAPRRYPPIPPATTAALTNALAQAGVPRTALILSDVPDWVAWHTDRPALLLPVWRDLGPVRADHDVAAIFLSPAARSRNAADGDTAWVGAIDQCAPVPGFSGPSSLPGGASIYYRQLLPRSKIGLPPTDTRRRNRQ